MMAFWRGFLSPSSALLSKSFLQPGLCKWSTYVKIRFLPSKCIFTSSPCPSYQPDPVPKSPFLWKLGSHRQSVKSALKSERPVFGSSHFWGREWSDSCAQQLVGVKQGPFYFPKHERNRKTLIDYMKNTRHFCVKGQKRRQEPQWGSNTYDNSNSEPEL